MNFFKISLLFLISSFSFSTLTLGQTEKQAANLNKGIETETSISKVFKINNDFLMNDNYKASLPSGKRLIELDSLNANYNYRYGLAIFKTSDKLSQSLPYLKKGASFVDGNISLTNAKEKRAPLEALFYYGVALHRYGRVDDALIYYQKFNSLINKTHPFYDEVQLKIKQANNAKSIQVDANVKSLTRLSDTINSAESDFSPIISFDGERLYFTSSRPWNNGGKANQFDPRTGTYFEDVYMSEYGKNGWKTPVLMDFDTPTDNEASVSMSIDEREVYLYNSKTGNGDIYSTAYKDGSFNKMQELKIKGVNTDAWQTHYYVSSNGKLALFTSEAPGGYGGLDIYMMTKDVNGNWSTPTNLGPEINTKYNEDAPYLTFDGRYLYFSSDNEQSIGGYDIFKAEYKDGKFINPQNLGTPINSTYDDLYYTVTTDGLTAFISSFRDGGFGGLDIYEINYNESGFKNSVLKGRIYMANGDSLIPENIEMHLKCLNCSDSSVAILLPRIRDGKFMANLEKCKNYKLTYYNKTTKKDIATQALFTNCKEEYEEIYRELGIEVDGKDIRSSMNYAMKGSVYDKESGEKLSGVTIEIQDKNQKTLQTLNSDTDGKFISDKLKGIELDSKNNFVIVLKKPGYITVTDNALFVADGSTNMIDLGAIGMEKATVGKDLGKVLALNPIYYDLNSSYLRKDAKVELDKIVKSMNNNPSMVLQLRSHTDCRETAAYNIWLSDRRADRAADYIKARIKNGGVRISGEGFGESQLVNECACGVKDTSGCTEAQHQANRRTEFIIMKE